MLRAYFWFWVKGSFLAWIRGPSGMLGMETGSGTCQISITTPFLNCLFTCLSTLFIYSCLWTWFSPSHVVFRKSLILWNDSPPSHGDLEQAYNICSKAPIRAFSYKSWFILKFEICFQFLVCLFCVMEIECGASPLAGKLALLNYNPWPPVVS